MSKFKVGELVRIRDDLVDGKIYGKLCCYFHLSEHGGETSVICDISKNGNYKIFGKWFSEEMIEPYKDNVESLYPHLIQVDSKLSDITQQKYDELYELYKHYILAKPVSEREFEYVPFTIDDSVDTLRYCMNDLITTNNCCEKIKEEKDMNKVVTLWYERKRKSIEKKYDKLREEFGEKQYNIIESFNELVDKFNKDLDGLFQLDKASEQFVLVNNAPNNVIKYKIDVNKLDDEFNEMYRDEIRKAYKKIDDTREEVEAQLSLSDDLKYQQEVLERYNIISKKTKKISD